MSIFTKPVADRSSDNRSCSISVSNGHFNVEVGFSNLEDITMKLVLPDNKKYVNASYEIILKIFKKEKGSQKNEYSYVDEESYRGTIKFGDKEITVPFKVILPDKDYIFNIYVIYSGKGVGKNGYIDNNGNLCSDTFEIDSSVHPLDGFIIKAPDISGDIAATGEGALKQAAFDKKVLTGYMERFFYGHNVIKTLKTTADAIELEGTQPINTDSNATIYYSDDDPSGLNIWRSYSLSELDNIEYFSYDITFNYLEITDVSNQIKQPQIAQNK